MSGLNNTDQKEWRKLSSKDLSMTPIARISADPKFHAEVLSYLVERMNYSEEKMKQFYSRWRVAEMRHQAYINLPDYEKMLKAATESGAPPEITSIVVPYSFATINTIVTYLVNAFTGRKPMFTLGTYSKESMEAVKNQEIMLQHNADHTRLVRHLYQFLNDGQLYGVGVMKTIWINQKKMRTVLKQSTGLLSAMGFGGGTTKSREVKTVYEGNSVSCVDPFMFFPDPRVPMIDVARKGEYCFWRAYTGKHELLMLQAQGTLFNVDKAGELPADSKVDSLRNIGATKSLNRDNSSSTKAAAMVQEDTCTIKIIPAELGLGQSQVPETWLFTILNKKVIAQAQPLDYDHDMLPVAVHEPYTTGYGFGHNGMSDFLAPIQDGLSWFMNSHIYNVRATLNNSFVVDPSRVEIQDVKNGKPGKIIRVKQSAMGQDVRSMITQLAVTDVTRGHLGDFGTYMRMGDSLSAINDNLRGMTEQGGRRSATEARTSAEAGMSRLASLARLISAQSIVDLTEQMSINIMQFMSQEYAVQVLGPDGASKLTSISPEMVVGDFYFPVNDGTLPIDKIALLDVWKEIFMGVAQDPQLRQTFDLVKIFEHTAELGGAKDVSKFKLQLQPTAQAQGAIDAGNGVPVPQALEALAAAAGGPPVPPNMGGPLQ